MDDYEALVAERDLLRTAIDRVPALIGHWSNDLRCDLANTAYGTLLGGDAVLMRGLHMSEVLGPELFASNFPMVRGALDGIPQHFDRTLVDAVGVTRHLQVDYQPDIAGGFFVQVADVSERMAAQQRLEHAANHDDLTGLANRRQFISALEEAVGRETGEVALVYCDLDDFKSINDRHGHAVGDTVLCQVAERLSAVVRPSDLVARLGGDEFVILIAGGIPEASVLVERITERMRPVFPIGDLTLAVRASIGAAIGVPGASAEDLFARADADMYRMKPGTPRRALRARVLRAAVGRP